nr:uncharacterized protein LOC109159653 [Ipomoea batatas]
MDHISPILTDLHITPEKPVTMFCDNRSAVAMAENHAFHESIELGSIDCHLIREKVSNGLIKLLPISSQNQIADGFIKPLPAPQFKMFVSKLGIQNLHGPALGRVIE